MNRLHPTVMLGMLGRIAVASALLTGSAWASAEQSRFEISGNKVQYELRDVSRKEVLERLLASQGIIVEWKDQSIADELVTGRYDGTIANVARQLLTGTDFVLRYDMSQGQSRIVRVLVLGRAAPGAVTSPKLAALDRPNETRAGTATQASAPRSEGDNPLPPPSVTQPEASSGAIPMPLGFGNFAPADGPMLEPPNGQTPGPVPQPGASSAGMPMPTPGAAPGPIPMPSSGGMPLVPGG